MRTNPILDELYAIREKLLADAGGDLQEYLRGLREREAASGRLLPNRDRGDSQTPPAESDRIMDPA